ncbi:hypothetical protein NMG60_11030804, partial [Bertholletia excelsa]
MGRNQQFVSYFYCFLGFLAFSRGAGTTATDSPPYTVVRSVADVEIRLYKDCSWMSALVRGGSSFEKATKDGFHRLYQYLNGSNLNSSRLPMTAPVLTTIPTPPVEDPNYVVRLYLPARSDEAPPQPLPELNLAMETWGRRCMAARKFSGFAKDENINREIEALLAGLDKISGAVKIAKSYTIAQYSGPFRLSGRMNEVWVDLTGVSIDGCLS